MIQLGNLPKRFEKMARQDYGSFRPERGVLGGLPEADGASKTASVSRLDRGAEIPAFIEPADPARGNADNHPGSASAPASHGASPEPQA